MGQLVAVTDSANLAVTAPTIVHRFGGVPSSPAVLDDCVRREEAGGAGDAAARVGSATAQIEAFDWGRIPRALPYRPDQQLIEPVLTMTYMAAGNRIPALDIRRSEHLALDKRCIQIVDMSGQ